MFADGSRLDDGATSYAVVQKNGQSWVGIKTHMGFKQEACGAERAALARALESASRRQMAPERVTIFTNAQAAIRWMASEEPGPGQNYALQARKHRYRGATESPARYHHRDPVVPSAQGSPREREGRRMGQAPGGGARRPWGGMAELLGSGRGTRNASPKISCTPQVGDLREELGGGTAVGGRPEFQEEIQDAGEPEAGWHDGTLPYRAGPTLDEEPAYRSVLVVPIPDADPGAPIQGVPRVEAPAEDPVDGGAEGDWEGEEPVEDPGPHSR